MLDCNRFSGDLALRPLCCARMILLKEAMTQKASKGFSCDSAKKGSLGLGIQGLWIRRVFLILCVCLGSSIPQHGGGRQYSDVAAPTMPATTAPTMPAEAAQVEELDPQTMAVESVLFRENPRLYLAAASLVAIAPRPPMGAMPAPAAPLGTKRKSTFADVLRATPKMKGGPTGRIAARSWDQVSEASSSRNIDRNLSRLPDPIAELSPLAYRMYAKVGPETTRLVGHALERYNKLLMLDYSEEVMEPKETPFIPCWTALQRCLEEDLAEAKKAEESAGDFVEGIFGPMYSCTPKKESGDSASVGCLTEDLEEQTKLRLPDPPGFVPGKDQCRECRSPRESEIHPEPSCARRSPQVPVVGGLDLRLSTCSSRRLRRSTEGSSVFEAHVCSGRFASGGLFATLSWNICAGHDRCRWDSPIAKEYKLVSSGAWSEYQGIFGLLSSEGDVTKRACGSAHGFHFDSA